MSAVAAARLKAAAPLPIIETSNDTPTNPLVDSSASESAESESEDVPLVHQNFKLGTWRKHQGNVLSDSPHELTISLEKHSTATFVGWFDLKVLRGAVNINGANLGATPKGSKEDGSSHRVFVPSTHPITKIRGLDRTNHVQLRSCPESTTLEDISPLFFNIWGGAAERDNGRTFNNVILLRHFASLNYLLTLLR